MGNLNRFTSTCCLLGLAALTVSPLAAFGNGNKMGQKGGFYVQLEGFDARVNNSFLNTIPFAANTSTIVDVGPPIIEETTFYWPHSNDDNWGFRAAIGYDFPDCSGCYNYGLSLEYTHFNDHNNTFVPPTLSALTDAEALIPLLSLDVLLASDASARLDTHYHTLDLLAHRNVYFCTNTKLQFFAGARYIRLKEDLDVNYNNSSVPFEESIFSSDADFRYRDKFDGIGPRMGANFFLPFGCYVGLTAEVAGMLLFGQNDSDVDVLSTDVSRTTSELAGATFERYHHDKTDYVVPGLSGKIGLAFNARFCNCSSLSVEVGYRGDKYFNIADVSTIPTAKLLDVGGYTNPHYADFDISGPYVSATFHL